MLNKGSNPVCFVSLNFGVVFINTAENGNSQILQTITTIVSENLWMCRALILVNIIKKMSGILMK